MKLLKFIPSHDDPFANKISHAGTVGWAYKVEIWTEEADAERKQRYYPWMMPVYTDNDGDYITFEATHLRSILGKIYLKNIDEVLV